jgi:phosphoribosylanthranilate isomerase
MYPKVKICGITDPADAQFSVEEGADALGFIFYRESPRYISPAGARLIIESLPRNVLTVGVCAGVPRMEIEKIIAETHIDAVQLSGDEPPAECLGYAVPVIKSFRLRRNSDIDRIADYSVAGILLDGHREGMFGGTGHTVDIPLARQASSRFPIILAGGLTPDNIIRLIREIDPVAVDVNSGVERKPGRKDFQKISLLFRNLRKSNLEF